MKRFSLRFELRAHPDGKPHEILYQAALDMAEYGDRNGFHSVTLSEHHGVFDGYMPSPIVFGAGIAGRTRNLRLQFMALIAPLHDPLRLAEDLAVLDQVSGGRVEVTLAGGYVPGEFAMFGKDPKQRGAMVEEAVRVLEQAWTGEPFLYRGHEVRVTPRPVQRPRPPILMGGSGPLAARRAGRIADGFVTYRPDLYQIYFDEAKAQGKNPAPFAPPSPGFVHVTEDKAAAWEAIAPHAMQETNCYAEWIASSAGSDGRFEKVSTIEQLKATGSYVVVTPDECVALASQFQGFVLHPLMGGLDPAIGWKSLELFVDKVMPRLT